MSEFEKFEIKTPGEMATAETIVGSYLPQAEAVMASDRSLHMHSSYDWDDGLNFYSVAEDRSDDGTHRLIAIISKTLLDTYQVKSTIYTLVLNNGRFLAQRSIDSEKNVLATPLYPDNPQEDIERDVIEFEAGLLMPNESDWSSFISVLRLGESHAALRHQSTTKASRLARLLARLRKSE